MNNLTMIDENQIVHSFTRYLSIYLNLFYLIFGNIGNLLKIAFFLQKPLRALPCTIYILFATISDFVTLNNLPIHQLIICLYPKYHSIDLIVDWSNYRNGSMLFTHTVSNYDIIVCKLRSYLHMLSTDISSQMLLFASINRFCIGHSRKSRQKNNLYITQIFSHFPNVHKLCLITSFISAFVSLHHVFNFTIQSPSNGCIPRYHLLWTGWIVLFHCLLLPSLMITFGILTLRNLRYSTAFHWCLPRRVNKPQFIQICPCCIRRRHSIQHKIDNQLTSMIITEIFVTVCTLLPYGTYALYHLLYGNRFQTTYTTEWISFFIRMTMYFEASCGFYIYLMTLTTLRKRFFKSFIKKIISIQSRC